SAGDDQHDRKHDWYRNDPIDDRSPEQHSDRIDASGSEDNSRKCRRAVSSGVKMDENHRFEIGHRAAPLAHAGKHAAVLGPIKAKPPRVAAKMRPALTVPASRR